MKRRVLWAVACLAVGSTAAVALSASGALASPRASTDQSYSDPVGDAGVGTDIVGVTVRNDASGGVSIQIASANPIVANHAVAVFIDSDRNQATGNQGDDYWMYGGPETGVGFFAWNGSSFVKTDPPSFKVGAAASNVTEFDFNKSDIGNVSGFNFVAVSISIDGDQLNLWDSSPDNGDYSYNLTTTTPPPTTTTTSTPPPAAVVKPVIGAAAPASLVAGKHATVSFSVTRSDNSEPLTSGTMTSSVSVGGKKIPHTQSFSGGHARVLFVVPKSAKGKALRVTVTIKTSSGTATKVATFHVK